MRLIGILAIAGLVVLTTGQKTSHGKVVVCPILFQSILDTFLSEFNIDAADWNLCTHLVVIDNQFVGLEEVPNEQKESDYKQITNLKKRYPHLTITKAVSLVNLYKEYRALANESGAAENLLKDIIEYAKTRTFDGLDLNIGDFEQGSQKIEEESTEPDQIFGFLDELAKIAQSQNQTLTLSLSATVDFLSTKSDIAKFAEYFELVHLFQLRAVSDRDHSKKNTIELALTQLNPLNVQKKIDKLIEWGISPEKIVLGVNFGGPSATTSFNGNITEAKTERIVSYSAICELLSSIEAAKWQKSYDNNTKLSILTRINERLNETSVILYARSRTIANFMKLVVEKDLAGALAFTIDMDDFKGLQCGMDVDTFDDFGLNEDSISTIFERTASNYPLLRTMGVALTLAVHKNDQSSETESIIAQGPTHGKHVVCPIVTQSVINTYGSEFSIDNADWHFCSHLIVIDNKFVGIEGVSDEQRERDYKQLTSLRANYPHLKISLAVSMLSFYEAHLTVAYDPSAAPNDLSVISNYLESHGFDGLDLNFADLEESLNDIDELSIDNDTVFGVLQELRENLQVQNLLLTSSFSASVDFFSTNFDFSRYAEYFDLVHLFALRAVSDRKQVKSNNIGHALRELNPLNVQKKIDKLIEWGIMPEKIVLGVNFGGPSATTATLNESIIDAKTERIVGYNSICEILSGDEAAQWEKSYDNDTGLSILAQKDEAEERTHLILYAGSRVIANYVHFAVKRGLAGALVFAIDMDDFNGQCNADENTFEDFEEDTPNIPERNRKNYPLLQTVNEVLSMAKDRTAELGGSDEPTVNESTTGSAASIRNPFYTIFDLLGVL